MGVIALANKWTFLNVFSGLFQLGRARARAHTHNTALSAILQRSVVEQTAAAPHI